MSAFQNIDIEGYLKRYGIVNAIKRGVFTAFPIHMVKDYENRKILWFYKTKRWVKKKYLPAKEVEPKGLVFFGTAPENPVWIYWKQGEDKLPDIVRICISSVKKWSGRPVIVLSDNNIGLYVKLPEEIEEKVKEGSISFAAYSDLLRFSLLEHFGGTWIDATVMLTCPLPDYILESELFAFRDSLGTIQNPALYPSWLLHCRKHNRVMRQTRNIAFAYWKKEKHVKEYLLPYLIFGLVVEDNNAQDTIPYAVSEYTHLMLEELDRTFDQRRYDHILEMSGIHKMTYKLKEQVKENPDNVYAYLMSHEM